MKDTRSLKTVLRDNAIHEAATAVLSDAGEYASELTRTSLYIRVAKRTGCKKRKVQDTLNHTIWVAPEKLCLYD